jgi:hypothetical protein
MLSLICFIIAIVCWFCGAFNVPRPAVTWLCAGLAFAGLGLWVAPLLH